MKWQVWLVLTLVIIAIFLIYLKPSMSEKELACINSGGNVETAPCCKSVSNFPNNCLIGACGCSPENSHEVKVCICSEDKCFNGSICTKQ